MSERSKRKKVAEVKWIKIVTDIFDDEKVLLIETLPEADSIIVIWFKLLCLAGKQNNSGVFVMNGKIPYTDKMLATIFRRNENTVKLALETFKNFGMIEIIDDVITIPNWEKHQKLDQLEIAKEQTRKRVAKYREKQKKLANGEKEACNVTREVTVTQSNADRIDKIRIDKIRIDKDTAEITEYYENNIGMMSPAVAELLFSYLEDFEDYRIIIEAIKIATLNNKRTGNYINGILKSWKSKGYKVLADLQNEQKQEITTKNETEEEKTARRVKELEEALKNDKW